MPLAPSTTTTTRTMRLGRTITLNDSSAMHTREYPVRHTPRTVRLTVNLPSDLVDKMRNAVYWTPGLTLAWFIGRALCTSLGELETANKGPFPKRLKPLRAGRPRLLGQSMELHPRLARHAAKTPSERSLRARLASRGING